MTAERLKEHLELCPDWAPPDCRGTFIALALAGEAGELANNYKKEWRDGHGSVSRNKIIKELGDCGAYCLMLAVHEGEDLALLIERVMSEFENRPEYAPLLARIRERGQLLAAMQQPPRQPARPVPDDEL